MINQVVTSFSKYPKMGIEPIFQSAAEMPKRPALDVRRVIEPLIQLREPSIGLRSSTSKDCSEPTERVRCQVNPRPEVIQR
jgi:hypothetical protein